MRLSLALIFVVFAFLASVKSQRSPQSCTYENGNKYYNFTKMIKVDYYQFQPSGSTTKYIWNVCRPLPYIICGGAINDGALAACQQSSGNYYNTGLLSTGIFQLLEGQPAGTDGMQILYNSNGQLCSGIAPKQTQVRLICVPGQATAIKSAQETSTKCVYSVELTSQYACSTTSESTTGVGSTTSVGSTTTSGSGEKLKIGGWIFTLILLLCSTTVYIL
eukprot:gene11141-13647_t